jgi:hypothetical protein
LELDGIVVAPTLGSIIPNWVLVIPTRPIINFALWCTADTRRPEHIALEVAQRLWPPAKNAIWFEHGPAGRDSVVGCGVDHAHLHVLLDPPFGFPEFVEVAKERAAVSWAEGEGDPYGYLRGTQSYLVAGCGQQFALAQSVDAVGSQFFRRTIAALVGEPDCWDYRQYPFLQNAAETVARQVLRQHWRAAVVTPVQVPQGTDLPEANRTGPMATPLVAPDYTDGRARWDWESRYPTPARKAINFEAAILTVALIVALVAAGLMLCLEGTTISLPSPIDTSSPFRFEPRILSVFFCGCVGGATFSIKWLVHAVSKGSWHLDRRYWRLFVPLVGGVYACAVLTLFDAGIAGHAAQSDRSISSAAAFSFLVGYFSDGVSGLLTNIAKAVFGTLKEKWALSFIPM